MSRGELCSFQTQLTRPSSQGFAREAGGLGTELALLRVEGALPHAVSTLADKIVKSRPREEARAPQSR
jgi:hypothetical protein